MRKRKYKKRAKESRRFLINLKVTRTEKKVIELCAKHYAKGNVSRWLRQAGSEYIP